MISFRKAQAARLAIDSAEPLDSLEPGDKDLALAADYAAGLLPPDQEQAVEERLVEDEEFFKLAAPLMQLSYTKVSLAKEFGFVPPPLPVKTTSTTSTESTKSNKSNRRIMPVWFKERYVWAAGLAATIIVAALPALPSFEGAVGIAGQHDVYSGDITAVAKARDFRLPDGSTVHLAQGGAMSYNARLTPHRLVVWLNGRATIDIPNGQDSIMVMRATGYVTLASNGVYQVDAPQHDPTIYVAVVTGGAVMTPIGTRQASLTLKAGQKGDMDDATHFTGVLHDGGRGASLMHGEYSTHFALLTWRPPIDGPAYAVAE